MSRLGSDEEFRKLAAKQASQFLPIPKKKGGRGKGRATSPKWDDPQFAKKLALGAFHDWPLAMDLLDLYADIPTRFAEDPASLERAQLHVLNKIGNWMVKAVADKDHASLAKLASAVEMFSHSHLGLGFADLRKVVLAAGFGAFLKETKRKPTASELIHSCRSRPVDSKVLAGHLDEALFRDIRDMRLPVAPSRANTKKKSR